ncbi:disease resistance protein RGA2-like [Tasmannia lanceolata]|uniref:disease resistance protein RGA2-like n=1 Tax=Tasmannia lanceolata TaxID=3420 RepID=UPI004062C67A
MADVILNLLLENLKSLIQSELHLQLGVEEDIVNLDNILNKIRHELEAGEAIQFKNKELKDWLTKLADAAYDADDILADWSVEAQGLEVGSISGCDNNQVSNTILPCFNSTRCILRHKIGIRIKKILQRLNSIDEERDKFNLGVTTQQMSFERDKRPPTISLVNDSDVYGRDEDKRELVKLLQTVDSNENKVPVVAIVGMGGLGKTTLAQMAYHDKHIESHFNLRMWISVSQDFDVTNLVKEIIETAGGISKHTLLENMQQYLGKLIGEKRFLLVLDDVWNEDDNEWEKLKKILTRGAEGSKILVTTRSEKVALIMGAHPEALHLKGLSEDDCWSVFERQAFESGRSKEHPNLVAIGKDIVKKCGGVPLAAKALGSLMRFKREESVWLSIKDSDIWELPQNENEILPALRLSYSNLPSHLRQCFSFCSLFPKGFVYEKEVLIHLWMANGLVPTQGRMELEDIGNEIFNGLLGRSFFQDIETDDEENVTRCKMHDLMHGLAQFVMGNTSYIMDARKAENVPKMTRHLYCDNCDSSSITSRGLYKAKTLRTLLLKLECRYMISSDFSKLRHLRVLDLGGCRILKLPHSIGNLKLLRYLNLSNNDIEELPELFSYLQNLQTLILTNCRCRKLPHSIGNLKLLRYLDLSNNCIEALPELFSYLQNLQTLILRNCQCRKLSHSIGKLKLLRYLDLSDNYIEALPESISHLENLQTLILRNFQYELSDSIGTFKHLRYLNLSHNYTEALPDSISHLQNLQTLILRNCSKLRNLPKDMRKMSSLRRVDISDCKSLTCLPIGIEQLSCLQTLSVFIVGEKDGCRLSELRDLNLGGELEITGLSSVRNVEDAEDANFRTKQNLRKLVLSWGRGGGDGKVEMQEKVLEGLQPHSNLEYLDIHGYEGSGAGAVEKQEKVIEGLQPHSNLEYLDILGYEGSGGGAVEMQEKVIEGLRPHSNLKYLHIQGYGGIRFPVWMQNSLLQNLVEVSFSSCNECENLPQLGQLRTLKHLDIYRMNKVKSIGNEFYGNGTSNGFSFPSLKTLRLRSMDNLETWESPKEREAFPSLCNLIISYCPKLKTLPCFLTLTEVSILKLDAMSYFPERFLQNHNALERLSIDDCSKLKSLPKVLYNFVGVKSLRIAGCNELVSLPDDMNFFTALEYLKIERCDKLESLPDGLQCVITLQQLIISNCKSLVNLPYLPTRLKRLEINNCPNLAR